VSRIDELIESLCPDGVPFEPLASIGDWYGGGTPSKSQPEFWLNGTIPWVSPKDMGRAVVDRTEDYITEAAVKGSATKIVPPTSVAMVVRSSILDRIFPTALIPVQVALNQDMKAVVPRDGILPGYVAHILRSRGQAVLRFARKTGGSVASIESSKLFSFRIPVPPVAVQHEIVRVLDLFQDLEAELEAELEARQRQYAFYRGSLLTFPGTQVRKIPMGEVLSMRSGHFISASQISSLQDPEHPFPCFGGNGLRGFVALPNHEGDYVLIGRQGAYSGNVKRVSGQFYATEHAVVATVGADLRVDWTFHMLTEMNLNQYASKGAQPGLAVGMLNALLMPVPALGEQAKTANALDKFDALANDPWVGLPAELKARRKQHEYYSDRLLTFEETAV
jgi:type I restriction enzyme S subunit